MQTETSILNDIINPIDAASIKAQFEAGRPHRYFVIDDFLEPEFAEQVLAEYPTFEEAQRLGHLFKAVNERLKVQISDSKKFGPSVLRLHEALASADFLALLSNVTGIPDLVVDPPMVGGGIHQTGPSGHLDVHLDFNRLKDPPLFRRLNILVFLNKNWQPEWGGNFELWDKDVKQMQQSFEPIFNRCVVFATTEESFHGVSAVKCPVGETRKSFAAYYYTVEAPAYYNGVDHSTIFRPRPDEYLKGRLLMPSEKAIRSVRSFIRTAKNRLKS